MTAGTLVIRAAGPADEVAWDAFVAARPEGDPLQTWGWGECSALMGERPVRIMLEGPGGPLRGVAQALVRSAGLRRTIAYVPHGPLWERDAPDADELLRLLLDGLREMGRRERAIVVKIDPRSVAAGDDLTLANRLRSDGARPTKDDLQAATTRIVDLTVGTDAIWASWDSDARNSARRAAKEGVTVRVERGAEPAAVAGLAELHRRTAQRAAFRGRSPEFLDAAARRFAATGGWYLVTAEHEGRPIASLAFLRVGDRAFYLWAGSDRRQALNVARGPYAALAAAIDLLAADGCRSLDLWGVVEPGQQGDAGGYSRFKRKFGGTPLRHPGLFDLVIDPLWYRLRQARSRLRPGRAGG